MKLCFFSGHKKYGGLSDNGGSKTIIKSAEALRLLGHSVYVVAHSDRHTWVKHPKVKRRIKKGTDVIVAASISDIWPMQRQAPKGAKLAYWARGFESWQKPPADIYKILRRFCAHHKILTNSSWLRDKFKRHKIKSKVVFSGMDLDAWQDLGVRTHGKVGIGCLHNPDHATKKWSSFMKLKEILGTDLFRYYSFGRRKNSEPDVKHFASPSHDELLYMYSRCHIFYAPTVLEGFHNCPAEACLCGALVVASDVPSNGMGDYSSNQTAMIYHTIEEAAEMCRKPDYSRVVAMQDVLKHKVGGREVNMKRMAGLLR